MDTNLLDFTKNALREGQSREDIRSDLARAGWHQTEVDRALMAWTDSSAAGPVPRPLRSSAARDAFLYALSFAAFATLLINLLLLAFGLLDAWMPEPNEQYRRWAIRTLRWSMAALIVFAPVFLLLDRRDARSIEKDPAYAHRGVRRWLMTIALFAAAVSLLFTGLNLIHSWLDGQMTMRFITKSGIASLLAILTILHFRNDAKERRIVGCDPAALGLAFIALIVLALSFWTFGGPGQGRMEERDRWRLSDLSMLKHDLQNCDAVDNQNLPKTLDPLTCARKPSLLTGYASKVEYTRVSKDTFKLCIEIEDPQRIESRRTYDVSNDMACVSG